MATGLVPSVENRIVPALPDLYLVRETLTVASREGKGKAKVKGAVTTLYTTFLHPYNSCSSSLPSAAPFYCCFTSRPDHIPPHPLSCSHLHLTLHKQAGDESDRIESNRLPPLPELLRTFGVGYHRHIPGSKPSSGSGIMKPKHLFASLTALSALSSAWPWPPTLPHLQAVPGVGGLLKRADGSSSTYFFTVAADSDCV